RGRWPRRVLAAVGASVLSTLLILWLDANPPLARAAIANIATLASLVLVGSTVILFVISTFILRLIPYRSVQSRLVTSFVLMLIVPVLITTTVSAIGAFNDSQAQFNNTLQAVASLRQHQVEGVVQSIALQMSSLQQGNARAKSILRTLYPGSATTEAYRVDRLAAVTMLRDLLTQYPGSKYEEVLVLDIKGNVVISTYPPDEGLNFAAETFFQEGSSKFRTEMLRYPGKWNPANAFKLVSAAPLYGQNTQDVRGVIVTVANGDLVLAAMGPVTGLPNAVTYMVNGHSDLVTEDPDDTRVGTWPVAQAMVSHGAGTSDVYINHAGKAVLGFIKWDPNVNAVLVAEVPRGDVYDRALASLLVSALVGAFAIVVAAITALSTSSAISEPIRRLAAAARTIAGGDLTTRAHIDQRDEVGKLADSFNAMASQLQGVIGNLEQRVAERTEALEHQSLRLRAAAEVARDAASAPSLDDLLDQAARLIRDRFAFYHTGIFLLDEKREYAVLRASPSDAGKTMLERRHSLKVGEQGIVGRVAATGEPRIALYTGVDPVYFNNPLLPRTRSEMALPLKTPEDTLGVIDIQSDQPEAFTQDDIAIVQVMADQLATAIQRTNLLTQVQTQLAQLERTYRSFTEQTWRTFGQSGRQHIGYRFDNIRLESIRATPENLKMAAEQSQKTAATQNPEDQTLQVPIRLRGQVIGVVNLRYQSARLPETTAAMVQQIADRLATALENARLLEDSLRRANKERAIGEITTKISASVNMRNVLQTAVEELGRAIPGSDVVIQFRPDTEI
ncbi:MAG: GAF domain-containing protein, partial [Anaerolineae bacterium]